MSRTFITTFRKLDRPIIIWDTETTGLAPTKNSLVEIGLMELECTANKRHVYSFSSLIHPIGVPMPRAASRVHGITNPMMQDAPEFPEVWAGVLEYVNQICNNGQPPILVAHNLQFDLGFLKEELRRNCLPFPENWDFVCSLRDVAHVLWPGEKASLAALTEKFSIINEEAHRALCDVEATSKFLAKADEELRRKATPQMQQNRERGSFIREMIEVAAIRRRKAEKASTPTISSFFPPKHSKKPRNDQKGNDSSMSKVMEKNPSQRQIWNKKEVQKYYVTPTGMLFHSHRSCDSLENANVILRVTRRPQGKFPCYKCFPAPTVFTRETNAPSDSSSTMNPKKQSTRNPSLPNSPMTLRSQSRPNTRNRGV